jgi:hypothetical protein
MSRLLILIVAVAGGALADGALAVTVNLTPAADAPLKQFMVDTNFRDAALSTRNATNNDQRTVVRLDIPATPAGFYIGSASLNLYGHAVLGSTSTTSIFLFRVDRSWLEDEVTYRQAQNFTDWSHLGGDFVGTGGVYDVAPYATWTGPQSGMTNAWYALDATLLVEQWAAGIHPNDGLLLRGAAGNELEFASSEEAVEANRPYLRINYVAIPEPAGLVLFMLGAAVVVCRRRGDSRRVARKIRLCVRGR